MIKYLKWKWLTLAGVVLLFVWAWRGTSPQELELKKLGREISAVSDLVYAQVLKGDTKVHAETMDAIRNVTGIVAASEMKRASTDRLKSVEQAVACLNTIHESQSPREVEASLQKAASFIVGAERAYPLFRVFVVLGVLFLLALLTVKDSGHLSCLGRH